MTIAETEAAPDSIWPGQGDEDETHLWCCDENVAMCGIDIADASVDEDAPDEQTCRMCVIVYESWGRCLVPGCTG